MKFHLVTGLLLMSIASAATAQDDNKFYAGSGVGMYYVDFDDVDFDESATTLRIFGGYEINERINVELGFSNLFEADAGVLGADVSVDGTAWDLSVRPSLPITDRIEAFGVLGYAHYDFEVEASVGNLTVSDSDSGGEIMYGLGASAMMGDAWQLRGEWILIDVEDADFGTLTLSATYQF